MPMSTIAEPLRIAPTAARDTSFGDSVPGSSTAPLFAEAAFQLRRFSSIPSILRRARRAELNRPELEPVARFWMERGS